MSWNYRVVKSTDENSGEPSFQIYEAFYNDEEKLYQNN